MSTHEHEHEPEPGRIKVVDRRRFAADGAARDNHQIEDRKKPTVPEAATKAAEKSRQEGQRGGAASPKTSDFLQFIASLATQAMAALGALPPAQARGMPVDPQIAREYIDIIAMLQTRTQGNLSPEEDQALQRLLAELRRGYAEASRATAPPMPPMPGAAPGAGLPFG